MGRPPLSVLADEVVDDVLLELLLEVHVVVLRANDSARRPRILNIFERTAGLREFPSPFKRRVEQPHRYTDDVVALSSQQCRSDGGVHTPTHRH